MDNDLYRNIINDLVKLFKESGISIEEASVYLEKCRISVLTEMLKDDVDSTFVIKKDGKVQRFDEKKLYSSIGGTSDEIQEPLNDGDLKNVVNTVKQKIKEKQQKIYTTIEIRSIILNVLIEMGFLIISKNYSAYDKE